MGLKPVWTERPLFGNFGFAMILSCYAIYRMTRRAALTVADSGVYSPIAPAASPIALELVQEYVKDFSPEEENS